MDFHTEMPDMSAVDSDNDLTIEFINSIQNGGDVMTDDIDKIDAELNEIFQRAVNYRKSAAELELMGGMDSDLNTATSDTNGKKKRSAPKALLVMQSIAKMIIADKKHGDLALRQMLKVASLIVKDAKKMTGKEDIEDPVLVAKYKELAKNPESYVKTVKEMPPKPPKVPKSQAGGADDDIFLSEAPARMGLF